jgi:hypothetical protein
MKKEISVGRLDTATSALRSSSMSETISTARLSSSDLRPASRIAVVAIVLRRVGSGRASSCYISFEKFIDAVTAVNEGRVTLDQLDARPLPTLRCDGIDELLKADVAVSSLPTEISFFIGSVAHIESSVPRRQFSMQDVSRSMRDELWISSLRATSGS